MGGLRDRLELAMAVVAIPLVLGASQLAVTLVNWLVTMLIVPEPLPKLDFSRGVPEELRTLVAVPTMLVSERNVSDLLEGLEVRYLANQDDHLHFALVTDFQDGQEETTAGRRGALAAGEGGNRSAQREVQGRSERPVFPASTAPGAGMRTSGCGWAMSGSAASSPP